MKVLTVVGARPQFVKAAVVSREIEKTPGISEVIVHTGQHYDEKMSDIFFEEMKIPKPDYHFAIKGLTHGAMTGEMLKKIEDVLIKEKPDWVLVYGDTNSTLAGALAASKMHIRVAHVEAGLRSFNMRMPEEQNRIITDRISSVLFCPTASAINNLKNEGYGTLKIKVMNVGDVMYDAARFYSELSEEHSKVKKSDEKFILVTCHRAENTDDINRIRSIIESLNKINKKIKVVFPIHPRTKKVLERERINLEFDPYEPFGYFDMIEMLKNCELVLTDSGGLQKEAYFFNKQCVTLRDETEWVELVENNVNTLVGANCEKIISTVDLQVNSNVEFPSGLYGDGKAAKKIVEYLLND